MQSRGPLCPYQPDIVSTAPHVRKCHERTSESRAQGSATDQTWQGILCRTSNRLSAVPIERTDGQIHRPTPIVQSGSNQSPAIVSSKTGISAVWVGDFRQILAKVAEF